MPPAGFEPLLAAADPRLTQRGHWDRQPLCCTCILLMTITQYVQLATSEFGIFDIGQRDLNPYPTAFPYENGMVLHFYQQQESSTTKTVHKVINKGLKTYV